jgi:hypothetical protein
MDEKIEQFDFEHMKMFVDYNVKDKTLIVIDTILKIVLEILSEKIKEIDLSEH